MPERDVSDAQTPFCHLFVFLQQKKQHTDCCCDGGEGCAECFLHLAPVIHVRPSLSIQLRSLSALILPQNQQTRDYAKHKRRNRITIVPTEEGAWTPWRSHMSNCGNKCI